MHIRALWAAFRFSLQGLNLACVQVWPAITPPDQGLGFLVTTAQNANLSPVGPGLWGVQQGDAFTLVLTANSSAAPLTAVQVGLSGSMWPVQPVSPVMRPPHGKYIAMLHGRRVWIFQAQQQYMMSPWSWQPTPPQPPSQPSRWAFLTRVQAWGVCAPAAHVMKPGHGDMPCHATALELMRRCPKDHYSWWCNMCWHPDPDSQCLCSPPHSRSGFCFAGSSPSMWPVQPVAPVMHPPPETHLAMLHGKGFWMSRAHQLAAIYDGTLVLTANSSAAPRTAVQVLLAAFGVWQLQSVAHAMALLPTE